MIGTGQEASVAKDKDARTRKGAEVRPKAIRRELVDVEVELERARRRRDKAQARVEALEAIAEQLSNALMAAERSREGRRAKETDTPRSSEPAVGDQAAATPTADAPADAVAPSVTPKRAASTRKTPATTGKTLTTKRTSSTSRAAASASRTPDPASSTARPAAPTTKPATRRKAARPPSGTVS
jgi:hypothetical protein